MNPSTLSVVCLLAVLGLLLAEKARWPVTRAALKMTASTAFVGVAVLLAPAGSLHAKLMIAALVLGWLGDAFLLSDRTPLFLAGLATFLLSHLCFALAFLFGQVSVAAFFIAAVPLVCLGVVIARWLWPHLTATYQPAVAAYIVAILLMCAAAAAYSVANQRWIVLVAAILFAASDISVARERFVARDFVNKLWGWPAYFLAQLLFAWSLGYGN